MFTTFENSPLRQLMPGFNVRFIHTKTQTLAMFEIEEGAILPEHSHFNEQVSQVMEGAFELTVDGQAKICKPGDVVVIPSHLPHSGRAVTNCRILDIFTPVREDYLNLPEVDPSKT